ncbi:MAG: hypothetical protein FWC77_01915 [Defluviitaleaceae bacterium]|nr:hypothetical protein [Defluviitaleaceae bacterium]
MRAQTPPQSSAAKGRKNQPTPRKHIATGRKQPNTRRARRVQPAASDTKVRKRGNVYFLYHKERKRVSWRLAITILLVFIVGVGSAVSFATIHNMNRQVAASTRALNAQLQHNLNLSAETTERYTHEEIARRARALGLSEPDPSQIIYFYAPVQSNVVFRYTPVSDQENHFWRGVIDFLRGLVERVI